MFIAKAYKKKCHNLYNGQSINVWLKITCIYLTRQVLQPNGTAVMVSNGTTLAKLNAV